MIYLSSLRYMKRKGLRRYHPDVPDATVAIIQRPFSPLSLGPLVASYDREEIVSTYKEYKKWMFRQLLVNRNAVDEFTRLLDIYIQEGDLVLQCSCSNDRFCHGNIIRDALIWASQYGIEDWQNHLKTTSVPK